MTPLVTVIIPTLDRPQYLREAIGSALGQTHENIEVLVFDNGTLDETLSVGQEAAHKDSRVRFRRNDRNLGISDRAFVHMLALRSSGGDHSLLDIAEILGLPFAALENAATPLVASDLLVSK